MNYLNYVVEILISINAGVASLLMIIGAACFFVLLFSKYGKTKKGMIVCISGYAAGAVGALSIMLKLIDA